MPKELPKFNEIFEKYKDTSPQTPCRKCGKMKQESQNFCSHACSAGVARNIDWNAVDLERLLVKYTYSQIAEQMGVSNATIHKRAKKLGLK